MILGKEREVARLEASYNDPAFFAKPGPELEAHAVKLKEGREEIPRLYARWEELEELKKQS